MRYHTKKTKNQLTPKEALIYLKEGNFRFINALQKNHDHLEMINETANGQWPFAAIVSCMDSRTSAELVFDQGIGDIFSLRVAGNLVRGDILGSLEYACKLAGSKLVVVMGHTGCGAIKGVCEKEALRSKKKLDETPDLENLNILLDFLKPAVDAEKSILKNRNSLNSEFVEKVCTINIEKNLASILENSQTLNKMKKKGEIDIVAAKYDVKTGQVKFFE